jgi:hypothetical protein
MSSSRPTSDSIQRAGRFQVRWVGLALAAICLLAAVLLAAWSGAGHSERTWSGRFLPEESVQVWRSELPFHSTHPEGTKVLAGDTLGWRLEEAQWQSLAAWAEGYDLGALDSRRISSELARLDLEAWIHRLIRPSAFESRHKPVDKPSDAGVQRNLAQARQDSLERALHQMRQQYRDEEDTSRRQALAADLQKLESDLNRARAERDRFIGASEGRISHPSRRAADLDTALLRALSDSLLSARTLLAPEGGVLQRSQAEGKSATAWTLIRELPCRWGFVWEEPFSLTLKPGSLLVLQERDGARRLETVVQSSEGPSAVLIVRDCHGIPFPSGEWVRTGAQPESSWLLRRWLEWRVRTGRE